MLVLSKLAHLGPKAMQDVRTAALKPDRHAYQVNADYRHTAPAE